MSELDTVLYDGQQRFNAIKSFLEGEFFIEHEGEKVYIDDFDESLLLHILNYTVHLVETRFKDYFELVQYYIKINRGGTLHTEEDIQKALDTLGMDKKLA